MTAQASAFSDAVNLGYKLWVVIKAGRGEIGRSGRYIAGTLGRT